MKSKIDMNRLRLEIRRLHRSHQLYRVLRDELGTLGHWKLRKRGNPRKAYQTMVANKSEGISDVLQR